MRTPQENQAGYDESASLAYADSLKSSFLLVHGTGDDNVHFQNSERLVERLEAANKQFDMRIYPHKTHSIAGGNTRENLYGLFTAWLQAHLAGLSSRASAGGRLPSSRRSTCSTTRTGRSSPG